MIGFLLQVSLLSCGYGLEWNEIGLLLKILKMRLDLSLGMVSVEGQGYPEVTKLGSSSHTTKYSLSTNVWPWQNSTNVWPLNNTTMKNKGKKECVNDW